MREVAQHSYLRFGILVGPDCGLRGQKKKRREKGATVMHPSFLSAVCFMGKNFVQIKPILQTRLTFIILSYFKFVTD